MLADARDHVTCKYHKNQLCSEFHKNRFNGSSKSKVSKMKRDGQMFGSQVLRPFSGKITVNSQRGLPCTWNSWPSMHRWERVQTNVDGRMQRGRNVRFEKRGRNSGGERCVGGSEATRSPVSTSWVMESDPSHLEPISQILTSS